MGRDRRKGLDMKRKIREDDRSPYIIINGSIHRPVPTKWIFQEGHPPHVTQGPHIYKGVIKYVTGTTRHKAGETVEAKNVNYTPYSLVGDELWTGHGVSHRWDEETKKLIAYNTNDRWAGEPRLYVPEYEQ
jgi:hypothetical protein